MLLSLVAAAGCSTGDGGTACTANFAYVDAAIVDAGNQTVVASWVVTDTVLRSGRAFAISQIGTPEGYATIFTDNNLGEVTSVGDSVRVTGAGGGKAFSATYRFGSAGGCHVQRIAGPDTIVAR